MTPYSRIIPRMNGADLPALFSYYRDLTARGVAGFIIFGGELETTREAIKELQKAARQPLFISSDLEQGLGQQLSGGTRFPPAMAIASAVDTLAGAQAEELLHRIYRAFALEARYAGINTIFAPVLDVNSNPRNPIIATRSFGETPEVVVSCALTMIAALQESGIIACGKHFPGHGDTSVDSHISLPHIRKGLEEMGRMELIPFRAAVEAGVRMIMLGHLSVPALDITGTPASLSRPVIDYLRGAMGFNGLVITDAMNMGALAEGGEFTACAEALRAGADLILHPSDPIEAASRIGKAGLSSAPLDTGLPPAVPQEVPDFAAHQQLSDLVSVMAIRSSGGCGLPIRKPFVVIINDDPEEKEQVFVDTLRAAERPVRSVVLRHREHIPWFRIEPDDDIVIALYSSVRAWKGSAHQWLSTTITELGSKAAAAVSFGNPYLLAGVSDTVLKISAYWDGRAAQKAAAERLLSQGRP